jgi:flagellar hook-associated protein 3 FlgL
MRVADKMMYAQGQAGINRNRGEQMNLQSQVASMKRITKPSDDPVAATKVLGTRVDIAAFEQYQKNASMAKGFLEFSDQSLGELTDILVRLKELAISQANEAGSNSVSRATSAIEVEQIFNSALQIGNRKFGDRYIFGGFRTNAAPFDPQGSYLGDHGEMKIEYNKDAYVPMNVAGSKVFLGMKTDDLRPEDPIVDPSANWNTRQNPNEEGPQEMVSIRGPASLRTSDTMNAEARQSALTATTEPSENIFDVIEGLRIALKTDNTESIQGALERIDTITNQVVYARAQLGSRVNSLDNALQSLEQASVDSKGRAAVLEDADTFQLFSDLSKNETTLKATLATSGKVVQMSLLDFLR